MHNLLLHHCVKKLASQLLTLTTTFSKENFAPSIMLEKQERGSEHYSFLLLRLTTAGGEKARPSTPLDLLKTGNSLLGTLGDK